MPAIVATQVFESMRVEPRPTRAEVSDAANAVDEGADAIMLAGRNGAGAFPVRAVQMLDAVIRDAESLLPPHQYAARDRCGEQPARSGAGAGGRDAGDDRSGGLRSWRSRPKGAPPGCCRRVVRRRRFWRRRQTAASPARCRCSGACCRSLPPSATSIAWRLSSSSGDCSTRGAVVVFINVSPRPGPRRRQLPARSAGQRSRCSLSDARDDCQPRVMTA